MINRRTNLSLLAGSEVTLYDIRRRTKEPVRLNVYDLWNLNNYTIALGMGAFHTGVQVYGSEYCYGGHGLHMSGIFEMEPCNPVELGLNCRYRETIVLGYTQLSREEVGRVIDKMGQEFTGYRYHVVTNNCNHFSERLIDVLCGRRIPGWINRVANMVARFPFLVQCLTPPHQQRRQQRQSHNY